MRSRIFLSILFIAFFNASFSQDKSGTVSGSIESTSHYYSDDLLLGVDAPPDRFASNTYLWVQYYNGPISAGIQYESYLPPLQGFPYQYEGNKLTHRFLRFRKEIIDITAGSFYEQFGSGLSFRSYEDRALGLNNSLDGLRVILKPIKGISLKALYGKPRRYMDYSNAYVRGIDGEVDIAKWISDDISIRIGGGIVSRYNPYTGPLLDLPETVNAVNTRVGLDIGKLSFSSEYVQKSADFDEYNQSVKDIGHALSVNTSFASQGFGIYIATRLLTEMDFQAERDITDGYSSINYLPSNTRQYTYLLSNLYPYSTQAGGEISIQADITYTIPILARNGKRFGTDIRLNYANVRGLNYNDSNGGIPLLATEKYYGDFNIEGSTKWNRKLKSHMAFQKIYFNKGEIEGGTDEIIESSVLIVDGTARLSKKISMRAEFQHLWTEQDHGNWVAGLAEITYSPNWSVYVSDMTDYRYIDQAHYYNFGISYRTDYFRVSMGYGRNREGYICSGGVCRKIPAYKGFSFGITSSF